MVYVYGQSRKPQPIPEETAPLDLSEAGRLDWAKYEIDNRHCDWEYYQTMRYQTVSDTRRGFKPVT